MPKLLRPHIPFKVRCRVALRQLGEMFPDSALDVPSHKRLLDDLLVQLALLLNCEVSEFQLDHNPALGARQKVYRKGVHVDYIPSANDPEFLIYRIKHDHFIKTNHRGDGAQHPDRVLIKKQRRLEQGPKPKRGPKMKGRGFAPPGRKQAWPKRPFNRAK